MGFQLVHENPYLPTDLNHGKRKIARCGMETGLHSAPTHVVFSHIIPDETHHGTRSRQPQDAMFGGSKYLACCTWAIMQSCGLGCLMHRHAREAIRNKYGIKSG